MFYHIREFDTPTCFIRIVLEWYFRLLPNPLNHICLETVKLTLLHNVVINKINSNILSYSGCNLFSYIAFSSYLSSHLPGSSQ